MKFIELKNGVKMPIIGFGTWQVDDDKTAYNILENAVSVGYRLFDTAQRYGNENVVGDVIKSAINGALAKREDFFITSKLWITHANEKDTYRAFFNTLKKLKTDYLDLYLIHYPLGDIFGAWRAMRELKEGGFIRAIGVSNFSSGRLMDFYLSAFKDMGGGCDLCQIEIHPFYTRNNDIEFLRSLGIAVESWGSFAQGKNDIFKNEILCNISKKYDKSIAQIILRWLVQKNIVVIPKSTNINRMRENLDIFDFSLNENDIKSLENLDAGKSLLMRDLNDFTNVKHLHAQRKKEDLE